MKSIILTSALVLGLAAPAFAGSADFAAQHFAADNTGIESVVFSSSTQGLSNQAIDILAELTAENTGADSHFTVSNGSATASTRGAVNDRAANIFAELLAAEDAGDH